MYNDGTLQAPRKYSSKNIGCDFTRGNLSFDNPPQIDIPKMQKSPSTFFSIFQIKKEDIININPLPLKIMSPNLTFQSQNDEINENAKNYTLVQNKKRKLEIHSTSIVNAGETISTNKRRTTSWKRTNAKKSKITKSRQKDIKILNNDPFEIVKPIYSEKIEVIVEKSEFIQNSNCLFEDKSSKNINLQNPVLFNQFNIVKSEPTTYRLFDYDKYIRAKPNKIQYRSSLKSAKSNSFNGNKRLNISHKSSKRKAT